MYVCAYVAIRFFLVPFSSIIYLKKIRFFFFLHSFAIVVGSFTIPLSTAYQSTLFIISTGMVCFLRPFIPSLFCFHFRFSPGGRGISGFLFFLYSFVFILYFLCHYFDLVQLAFTVYITHVFISACVYFDVRNNNRIDNIVNMRNLFYNLFFIFVFSLLLLLEIKNQK